MSKPIRSKTSWEDYIGMVVKQDCRCANYPDCPQWLLFGNYRIDHIQALARGGTDTLDNKQLLCPPCHDAKTFRPRGGATTICGDNYEAKKTARLARKVAGTWQVGKPKKPFPKGRKLQSRGFEKRPR